RLPGIGNGASGKIKCKIMNVPIDLYTVWVLNVFIIGNFLGKCRKRNLFIQIIFIGFDQLLKRFFVDERFIALNIDYNVTIQVFNRLGNPITAGLMLLFAHDGLSTFTRNFIKNNFRISYNEYVIKKFGF